MATGNIFVYENISNLSFSILTKNALQAFGCGELAGVPSFQESVKQSLIIIIINY